jgi:5-methylcytosine-specific restriction enzyme subunit McrC
MSHPKQLHWQHDPFAYADEPDLLVALVRMFRRGLDAALARGLRHDYHHEHERLLSVRGRVDISAAIRRPGPIVPIPCRFDEYTIDVRLNQLLLAAIGRCLRIPGVPRDDRLRLRRHLLAFEGVRHHDGSLDWVDRWTPSRLERHYEAAVRPAAMILRNTTLVDRPGTQTATSFLVDMNELVETFIGDRLTKFLDGRLEVEGQKPRYLDTAGRISVKPDLVFRQGREAVFVADVKYKVFDELTGASTADIYQLHTYAQIEGLTSGALISCVAAGRQSSVTDRISIRSSGITVHLWPINLRGTLSEIEADLLRLADLITKEGLPEATA